MERVKSTGGSFSEWLGSLWGVTPAAPSAPSAPTQGASPAPSPAASPSPKSNRQNDDFDGKATAPSSWSRASASPSAKPADATPAPPSAPARLLGDVATDTPIAATGNRVGAPKSPRLFSGAQVTTSSGTGTLVGFAMRGFLVRGADGRVSSSSNVTVAPGQTFTSVADGISQITPTASQKATLDSLLKRSVGSGKYNVADATTAIHDAGFEVFIAGGAVRDALQGVAARDVDLATSMWVREADKALSRAGMSTGLSRPEFGVMLVGRGTSGELDVCSLKNAAIDGFGFDLHQDIRSRDFTINALFYDPHAGVILDPSGNGVADVQNKMLRPTFPVGQEQAWLKSNPSVVLRFFKFTLRGYSYSPELLQFIKDNFAQSVKSMESLRRDRMLSSVVPSGNAEKTISDEMTRLGFPKSDIEALFPPRKSFFSRDDDSSPRVRPGSRSFSAPAADDDSSPRVRPGSRSIGAPAADDDSSPRARPSAPSSTPPSGASASALLRPAAPASAPVASPPAVSTARYVGPSLAAVNAFAASRQLKVVDIAPPFDRTVAVRLGRLSPELGESVSIVMSAGMRSDRSDNFRFVGNDGSWLEYENGNIFRGSGDKVFAGPVPAQVSSSVASSPAVLTPTPSVTSAPSVSGSLQRFADAHKCTIRSATPADGKLAIASGHLGRLPLTESAAEAELLKAGFQKVGSGQWQHDDNSWVIFEGLSVFRGIGNEVIAGMVQGPGPNAAAV